MFEKHRVEILVQEDARKKQMGPETAWDMISKLDSVTIGKGQKAVTYKIGESEKEDILKAAMGRSGNLRAPAVKVNDKMIIGFNELMYTAFSK